jgi:secreted trypsin-like serine protease
MQRLLLTFVMLSSNFCYSFSSSSSSSSSPTSSLATNDEGIRGLGSRIIGGRVASPMRHPYYTHLDIYYQSGSVYFCGGSLVAPDVILTAAHCIYSTDDRVARITAKVNYTQDTGRRTGYEYVRKVAKQIQYPTYNTYKNTGDVALLVLDRAVTGVPLVKLNGVSTVPIVGKSLTVVGFGDTSNGNGVFPEYLLEVSVPAVSQQDCNDANSYKGTISETAMLCAGPTQGGRDSCGGDSGGPLVVSGASANDDVQVGVVSFGEGCALANLPGVYARVSTYLGWIQDTICRTSNVPPMSCQNSLKPSPKPSSAPTIKVKPTRKPTKKKLQTRRPTLPPTEEPSEAPVAPPVESPVGLPTIPVATPVF